MVFSSNVFLFLFLPVFLLAYYLTPDRLRLRNAVVLIGSYVFYAWWRVDFLFLFIAVTVWNYLIGLSIARHGARSEGARRWLALGVTVDLCVLGYFKYANFGVSTLDAALGAAGFPTLSITPILLPIGISFYIFESISYIMDVYRGDTPATRNPLDFATFIALFPHLIAGPVFRYKDLAEQFTTRQHSFELFSAGCTCFMAGFIKKVFIADTLAPLANYCFALPAPTTADAWLGAISYTAQLYFDFSGYSQMAIGLGLMIGFRFVENFNRPYISQSITEFWRRWHISLSNWLRDYLYISLGGNRHGRAKTYRNLVLTMLLGGLWHGANWTFVLWGAWHGAWLALERALGVKLGTGFKPHRWLLTFLIVVMGWVVFRAENLGVAWRMVGAMWRFDFAGLSEALASELTGLQLATLGVAAALILVEFLREFRPRPAAVESPAASPGGASWGSAVLVSLLFGLSVLKLAAQSYSPFLYFQF